MAITKEARSEWKDHPVTQEFRKRLALSEQATKDEWAREMYTGENADQCLAQNAKALGGVQVLRDLGEMLDNYETQEGIENGDS